jgi:TorA maturation chaperone TorD
VKHETDIAQTASVPLDPEDRARANWYGLISRLFYAPVDSNLLAELTRPEEAGVSGGGAGALPTAWRALQEACRKAYPALIRQEYDTLFVGVGKSEVSPYLSGYAEPSAPDRYLVHLRGRLADWGLARRPGAFEMEDHISGLSDVMRRLIEEGRSLREQRRFFDEFAFAGMISFCAALQKAPSAVFYRQVAAVTVAFCEIEKAAFEMSEAA